MPSPAETSRAHHRTGTTTPPATKEAVVTVPGYYIRDGRARAGWACCSQECADELVQECLPDGDLLHCERPVEKELSHPTWCATCGYLLGDEDAAHVRWIWTWCAAETLRQLHWHLSRMEDPPSWETVIRWCGSLWRATGMRDRPEEIVAEAVAYLDTM